MTHVHTMPIELFIVGTIVAFLAKVVVYVAAACFVINYASKR